MHGRTSGGQSGRIYRESTVLGGFFGLSVELPASSREVGWNGYPEGISGSAIPLPARIVCLCDSYDALTHEKAYRRAFSSDEAISEILRLRELPFDPRLVDHFVPMVMSLRDEHDDLDDFLGAAARQTTLSAARQAAEVDTVWALARAQAERAVGSRSEASRIGSGDQAAWNRASGRTGERGGLG